MKNLFNIRNIINYFDYFILTIVIFTLLGDFIYLLSSIINNLIDFFNLNCLDLIHTMAENKSSVVPNNTINTTIIHNDGNWSNGIRS